MIIICLDDPWMDHRSWSRLSVIVGQASIVGLVIIVFDYPWSTYHMWSQRSLNFFLDPKRKPSDYWFLTIITTRSSCLCLIGVSWKSVARKLTLSFLISITHIASFHLVINTMGKSAWVRHRYNIKAGACFIGSKNRKKKISKYIQEYAHKVLEANSKYSRRYKAERSGRSSICARLFLSKNLKHFFSVFYFYDFLNIACKIKKKMR